MNPYGKEKFCKFRIPSVKSVGVYCIMENDRVVYIGEHLNLEQRFNSGYGVISPKNCFESFQTMNCKINNLILRSYKEKFKLELYFIKNSNKKKLKKELQSILKPLWNEKKLFLVPIKFQKLQKIQNVVGWMKWKIFGYLKNMKAESIQISLIELEKNLGFKLPKSARSYTAWWSNGGHSYLKTWMDAGYKVKVVTLGEKICFYKI